MRAMFMFGAVVSIAILLSEAVGLALLWSQGRLTSSLVNDLYELVMQPAEEQKNAVESATAVASSMDDISLMRVSRILELNSRESELSRIEQFLTEKKNELTKRQTDFENKQQEFRQELAALVEKIDAESTKQIRNVLMSLTPADAVDNMMDLTLEQNVMLIKGMPKTNVAKIMTEFNKGAEDRITRGREILQTLLEGKPDMELASEALNSTSPQNVPVDSR